VEKNRIAEKEKSKGVIMGLEGMCIDTYLGTINGIDIMFAVFGFVFGYMIGRDSE